jgi:tetratricopeptide (TPR) repeat protein
LGGGRGKDKLALAAAAGARRDYDSAARLLEELISESEAPAEAFLLLGRSYHALGAYPRALAAFRDYLTLKPKSAAGRLFAGRSYLALGIPHRAIPLLKDALNRKPNDPSILALLGAACLKDRRSAAAVEYLRRAVEASPEDKRVYRGYLNALLVRGIRLARTEDAELGAQMLRFIVDNGLDVPLPRLELGRLYREAGNLRASLDQYDRAASLAPDDPRIRWYRASLLMALGQDGEAREELANIRALGGDIPDLEWNAELIDRFMIRSFVASSDWRRAAEACKAWLKKRQPEAAIHAMLAESLRNLGDLKTAENHARRAVSLSPKEADLRYALILILWETENWRALETELDAAERLGADPAIVLRFRALRASRLNEDDKRVVTLVQDAIRATGPAPELMFALAERYLKLGLPELAEGWYRKARSVETGHERAYLGEIASTEALLSRGEADAERRLAQAYDAYLDRWPDNRVIRRERALFLVRTSRFKEASDELCALLAWEPANATLRSVLAYAYRKCGRYREAAVLLKGLLKERQRDLRLLLEFVHCLERAGAHTYATAVLEKALPLFPDSARVPLVLGMLRSAAGKTESALEAYREAAARDSSDPRPLKRMAEIYRKSGIQELADRYEREAASRSQSSGSGQTRKKRRQLPKA